MSDKEFLEWVAARLVVHGDSPIVDFIGKLCSIARAIPDGQDTPNTGPNGRQFDVLNERFHEQYDRRKDTK
jgi:hypothetical protein